MKRYSMLIVFSILITLVCFSQSPFASAYTSTTTVGISAISLDTITAKTWHLYYPVFQFKIDSTNNQFVFSCRQMGEGYDDVYLNKGGFAALSYDDDELIWQNETALFDLQFVDETLIACHNNKSRGFNRKLGYEKYKIHSKVVFTLPEKNLLFAYRSNDSDDLTCFDADSADVLWIASVPKNEDWIDVKVLNDSVILIAASGISAINLHTGKKLWAHTLTTAINYPGSLVYSSAKYKTVKQISPFVHTSTNENMLTQLGSNILITDSRIYFASRNKVLSLDFNGNVIWESDISDYEPAKMLLEITDGSLHLINFAVATHAQNFVLDGIPFILMLDLSNGEIVDQYGMPGISNLVDFFKSEKGLSFAGRKSIVELQKGSVIKKTAIPLNVSKYGQFFEFIDGNKFYTLKEGYYISLNSIDDELIYFIANNDKVYGIRDDRLLYEYHFTEIYKLVDKTDSRLVLKGLSETLITNRNFQLLATIKLKDNFVMLKDKLYFIDKNKIHIVDLNTIK